MTVSSN